MTRLIRYAVVGVLASAVMGCACAQGNRGQVTQYEVPGVESDWIRNGEPIEFEGETWVPQDASEILQDNEMTLLGRYRGVQFFIENIDVKPYNRLYTKMDRNAFRIYKKKSAKND